MNKQILSKLIYLSRIEPITKVLIDYEKLQRNKNYRHLNNRYVLRSLLKLEEKYNKRPHLKPMNNIFQGIFKKILNKYTFNEFIYLINRKITYKTKTFKLLRILKKMLNEE